MPGEWRAVRSLFRSREWEDDEEDGLVSNAFKHWKVSKLVRWLFHNFAYIYILYSNKRFIFGLHLHGYDLNVYAVKVGLSLYQLDILKTPFWFRFPFRRCLAGVSYIIGKNIFKFVFENLYKNFEMGDAYQSLLGICFAAVAINRSRTRTAWRLWYRRYLHEIDRK